jgi:hypothetical protein
VTTPAGVPVAVHLARGATAVRLPWLAQAPAEVGVTLRPPGWSVEDDRYVLDARGDLGSLTVTNSAS